MTGRTLVRRKLGSSATVSQPSAVPRPYMIDRPNPGSNRPSKPAPEPVKLHTDDWMHVELPRGDYILAALVALGVALVVSSVTVLPAILFFNWLTHASTAVWAKLILCIPMACGLTGAWFCLRRAKSDRIRQRLLDELRD